MIKDLFQNLGLDWNLIATLFFGGGIVFATLYFSGFVYLNYYFGHLGSLISFSSLSSTEIAVLGIIPLSFFILSLLIVGWLAKQISKTVKHKIFGRILSHKYFLALINSLLFFLLYYYFVCLDGIICAGHFPIRIVSLLTFGSLPIVGQGKFLFILFALPLLCFFIYLSLLTSHEQKRQETLKWWQYLIGAFALIIFFFYVVNIYSSFIFRANFTYNFILNKNNKIPVVQIIYSSPLVDLNRVIGEEQETDYSYNQITIEEIKQGNIYFKKPDEWFEDTREQKRFIGNFVLYFESREHYYVKPLADLANAYAGILIKVSEAEKEDDGRVLEDIVLSTNMEIRLFDIFVLPKKEVESMKYLALDVDDIQKGAKYDYKNFFDQ